MMQMLLDKKVDANAYDKKYGNALQATLARDYDHVMQTLLDKRVDINV